MPSGMRHSGVEQHRPLSEWCPRFHYREYRDLDYEGGPIDHDQKSDRSSSHQFRMRALSWDDALSSTACPSAGSSWRPTCASLPRLWCSPALTSGLWSRQTFCLSSAITPSGWLVVLDGSCEVSAKTWFISSLQTYTVLAVSKCVKHDETWNTVLKHVGVKIWCGTCKCDTGTQCWVHWVNVKAAHFGARMLKRRPPGGGPMPNRTEKWLFEGEKVDEMAWNFHGTIPTSRPTISTWLHPPGPPALCTGMQKTRVRVERLLGSVKQRKESDRVTIWQVNKTCRWQFGHLASCWWVQSSLHLLVRSADHQCSHPQPVSPDRWSQRMQPSLAFMSRLSSMSFVYLFTPQTNARLLDPLLSTSSPVVLLCIGYDVELIYGSVGSAGATHSFDMMALRKKAEKYVLAQTGGKDKCSQRDEV